MRERPLVCAEDKCFNAPLPGQTLCAKHLAAPPVPEPAPPQTEAQNAVSNPSLRARKQAPAPPSPEEEPVDAAMEISKLAQQYIAAEAKARLEHFRRQATRPGAPLRPYTFKAYKRPVMQDQTAMRHPETNEDLTKPGYSHRWVRKVDDWMRPSNQRFEKYRMWGAEAVTYRDGDGNERNLESDMGVAMRIPYEAQAAMTADATPMGAYNRYDNPYQESAEEAAREANRRSRGRAVNVRVEEGQHKSEHFEWETEDDLERAIR